MKNRVSFMFALIAKRPKQNAYAFLNSHLFGQFQKFVIHAFFKNTFLALGSHAGHSINPLRSKLGNNFLLVSSIYGDEHHIKFTIDKRYVIDCSDLVDDLKKTLCRHLSTNILKFSVTFFQFLDIFF